MDVPHVMKSEFLNGLHRFHDAKESFILATPIDSHVRQDNPVSEREIAEDVRSFHDFTVDLVNLLWVKICSDDLTHPEKPWSQMHTIIRKYTPDLAGRATLYDFPDIREANAGE